MSRTDVAMTVYGEINEIDTLTGLSEIVESDGGALDWLSSSSAFEIAEAAIAASRDRKPLFFFKQDTNYPLENVAQYCQENGIAYVLDKYVAGEDDPYAAYHWQPGMDEEREVNLTGDEQVSVLLSDLEKAAARGMEAVQALIDSVKLPPLSVRLITVSDEVIVQYNADTDAEETAVAKAGM